MKNAKILENYRRKVLKTQRFFFLHEKNHIWCEPARLSPTLTLFDGLYLWKYSNNKSVMQQSMWCDLKWYTSNLEMSFKSGNVASLEMSSESRNVWVEEESRNVWVQHTPAFVFYPWNWLSMKNKKIYVYSMYIRELQAKFQLNPLKEWFRIFSSYPENLVFYAKMNFF